MNKSSFRRQGDRRADQLRHVEIETGVLKFAEGSALIHCGDTRVLAAASIERRVPPFRSDSGMGWVTAEYSMLPRSTHTRMTREVARGRPSGRTAEIQRLIGRALRTVVEMKHIPELTVTLDCDVLQADGGTRTAAITAGYVALAEALAGLFLAGDIKTWPLRDSVAAISVGLCQDVPLLDLEYTEDSVAQVDLNVVATGGGGLVELQGTGEQRSFTRSELDQLVDLAFIGLEELKGLQQRALASSLEAVAEVRQRGGRRRKATPRDEAELWDPPKS